ncbi:patatin-like phospholipase family protein [Penaeicola halotolerans]|uniref:patatin-like phospholipase family protein n=1 Tax=Penaeicola halotolerans TaxID=2793196 RepID=UPI001CF92700|nr:patatin-like phospholipase family protein [Penaeicola halotolerans]
MKKKSVSLVLSSGGARGLAHIGVIEGLLEKGYEIKEITGCSMGALIGGMYAAGHLDAFKEWVSHLDRIDVFSLLDFTFSSGGFIRGEKVFNELRKVIPDCQIEDLNIPFKAVATDITNSREYIFEKGSLYTAIRASAAIPTVIKPLTFEGVDLVDGGVLNPIPVNLIEIRKDRLVVAVDVNAPIKPRPLNHSYTENKSALNALPSWVSDLKERVGGVFPKVKKEKADKKAAKSKNMSFLDVMNLSFDLIQDKLSDLILASNRVDILVEVSRKQCGTFEFYKAKELIELGKEAFFENLEKFDQQNGH